MSTELLELPDVALYHLLSVLPLDSAAALKNVFPLSRKQVFTTAERDVAVQLGLPVGLTFSQMDILTQAAPEDQVSYLIEHFNDKKVDYTDYVIKLIDEDEYVEIYEWALLNGRKKIALAILCEGDSEEYTSYAIEAMEYKCRPCLKYILERVTFDQIMEDVVTRARSLTTTAFVWAVSVIDSVSVDLVDKYLSIGGVNTTNNIKGFIRGLRALLKRLTKEELQKAYKQHLDRLDTGIDLYGGDYLVWLDENEKDAITNVFHEV